MIAAVCKKKTADRISAALAGTVLALFVVLCTFFLSCEADHKCSDAECQICSCIMQCENCLKSLGSCGQLLLCYVFFLVILWKENVFLFSDQIQNSLISQKVRLNN